MPRARRAIFLLWGLLATAAVCAAAQSPVLAPAPGLSALIVGGGPSPEYNQVAIESNVRYVDGLLPPAVPRRVLFADGHTTSRNVLYNEPDPVLPSAETAFRVLFELDRTAGAQRFRATRLKTINGPALKPAIDAEFERLSAQPPEGPLLLYFTGHGARDDHGNLDNNVFNLWDDGALSVRELAARVRQLPPERPVVLVMVQCFGGSFANLLFENGDPAAGVLTGRPFCGFFATTRERVAAGCTPEVDEADYHDFTGSFFAALTGKDRLGKPVHATDFDGDGIIEMDEALAYAQMSEPSIDVPICTSDVFLRRFVPMRDDEVAGLPFSVVRGWASPEQRAVLDRLSADLHANGENRLKTALEAVRADAASSNGGDGERETLDSEPVRQARAALRHLKVTLIERFPGLRRRSRLNPAYKEARAAAVAYLAAHGTVVDAVAKADGVIGDQQDADYRAELRGARWLRLMRAAKTVVLERKLRDGGEANAALLARFEKLRALEHRNLFVAAGARDRAEPAAPGR